MHVLVLNCGSSSVRFQLIATDLEAIAADADRRLAQGRIERIGGHALISLEVEGRAAVHEDAPLRDHRAAVDRILRWVVVAGVGYRRRAIGRRHPRRRPPRGPRRRALPRLGAHRRRGDLRASRTASSWRRSTTRRTSRASAPRASCSAKACRRSPCSTPRSTRRCPKPPTSTAIPYQYYRRFKIRRYGFHGTSHRYVAYRYRKLRGIPREQVRIVTLHLGNGCSACAIRERRLGRHLDGLHAARGTGDGDALRRPRPLGARVPGAQGGHDARRGRRSCSTSSPGCSASRA